MATYYKYAEEGADSHVNWAEIGKSMSDMLLEESRIREEKKAAIDKASRDFGQILANSPQGEHKGANDAALTHADNASQFMLMQDRLLKSGQLKLKDYTISRQNILDDTNNAFSMFSKFQDKYKEKMDRYKKDESQLYEVDAMERLEGFGDFSKSGLYINPATGSVSVGMRELQNVDGKDVYVMAQHPDKMTSVNTLNGLLLGTWDKYNADKVTTAIADANGKQIDALTKGGMIESTEDILNKPEYIAAETNAVNAALANDFNRLSLLTDTMKFASNGKQYRFVRTEAEAKNNPEAILMLTDPQSLQEKPQFSDEQLNDSVEWMRTDARRKYDYEKKLTQKQAQYQPEYMYNAGKGQKTAVEAMQNIGKLWGAANGADMKSALTALRDINDKVADIKRTPDGIDVTYNDGTTKNFPFNGADGKLMTQEQFILSASAGLAGNVDAKTAIANGGLLKGAAFNTDATESASVGGVKKSTPALEMYGNYVENKIPKDMTSDEEIAFNVLNKALSGIGASVRLPFTASTDNIIVVKAPDGTESQEINLGPDKQPMDPEAIQAIKDFLKAHPKGKDATEQATWASGLKQTGVLTGGSAPTGTTKSKTPAPTK
jgi:hypothetical protein